MKSKGYLLAGVLLMAALLAAGCAAPFSKELLKETDQSITVDTAISKPGAYQNALVVWGGKVLDVKPRERFTMIEVLEKPLDYQKKPKDVDGSRGRFMARYEGFLDPSVFSHGRRITVVGRITGTETASIGEFKYTYPVVTVQEYHLWPRRTSYAYPVYPYYPYSPFYDPWWYY